MKRFIAWALVLTMVLCVSGMSLAETPTPSRGFDSPEACVTAVTEALISGDAQAFLDCFAIGEVARGFQAAPYAEKVGALILGRTLLQPNSAYAIAYNEAYLTRDILSKVVVSSMLLANSEVKELWGSHPLTTKDYTAEQLAAMADMGDQLSQLTYRGTLDPAAVSDKYAKAFEMQSYRYDAYGMTEWRETVVTLDFEGRTVYMAVGLARYDQGWLAMPMSTVIGALVGAPSYALFMPEDLL